MPFWAVARTLAHRETFAAERVGEAGFEVFAPRIRERVPDGMRGVKWRISPLFRSYLFVHIVDRWRVVERTLGVLKLVKFGDAPARCPDVEIEALLERADKDGVIRLPPRPVAAPRRVFARGDKVKISDGPFRGLAAIHSGMSAHEREVVLINLLGRQTAVAVPAGSVVPAQ
jgi:transcriptional antiterminator RfaH